VFPLTLLAWNCCQSYRTKAYRLGEALPDLAVISECEHPDKLVWALGTPVPTSVVWVGNNVHKGLAVFSYTGWALEVHPAYDASVRYVVPVVARKDGHEILLFACWTQTAPKKQGYVAHTLKAEELYRDLQKGRSVVWAGDFNSHPQWDRERPNANHSTLVERFQNAGITSCYHQHFQEETGAETQPTHIFLKSLLKPFHLDYIFASADLMARLARLEVGKPETWLKASDHMPLWSWFE
jgi:exodeoxyribonuclease-3